jgi:adenylosuccinate lyase
MWGDNTSLLQMRDALRLVRTELLGVIAELYAFAERYKDFPCLRLYPFPAGTAHQAGKRATLWLFDLLMDLEAADRELDGLRFSAARAPPAPRELSRPVRGDAGKVAELELRIAKKNGL